MKSSPLLLFLLLFFSAALAQENYQDVVYLKNGSIIHGMITEQIPNKSLKIKTADNNIFFYQLDDIDKITKEIVRPEILQAKGKEDANKNYKGRNSGAAWTTATTVVTSPLLGLIPALACSSAEPNSANLNVKNQELMKNENYNQAYIGQAHKIKRHKIWKHYGIASVIWISAILFIL